MNLRNLPERVHSIQEIRDIAYRENMPLETMRFFIGVETYESRCYGIYHDYYTEEFVVYKNKADGTHVERYRGKNEEEAAQIIYDKMLEEIRQRIPRNNSGKGTGRSKKPKNGLIRIGVICCIIAFVVVAFQFISGSENSRHRQGYYVIDDDVYYYQSNHWYYFDDYYDDWYEYHDYGDDWYDYYVDDYYFEDADNYFYNSSYYEDSYDNNWNNDSDDDCDYDWDDDDWDDWDWNDSDWDSDW